MNPDGQSRNAALIRGFEYCLSLLSTWLHMSKFGVRLLTQVRLLTKNLRYLITNYCALIKYKLGVVFLDIV